MELTFGDYLMVRRVNRLIVNRALVRRIQAIPGIEKVTTFDKLVETAGELTRVERATLSGYWRTYCNSLRRDARSEGNNVSAGGRDR